jgi:pimeloyl-ACP methyl ester carboxylesterase
MRDRTITVDDRKIAFTDTGPQNGYPVFYFHGAPSSRFSVLAFEQTLATHGVRLIAADRPGYGGSSHRFHLTTRDCANDVLRIADCLNIDRFAVVGYSGGGPYALTCTALAPIRVTACLLFAGVTDMAWEAAREGYPPEEFSLMQEPTAEAALAHATARFGRDGRGLFAMSTNGLSELDRTLLAEPDPLGRRRLAFVEAFRQGVVGYAHDIFTLGQPSTFDPAAVGHRVQLRHSELDRVVPISHSEHTASLFPAAARQRLPGHGHLSVLTDLPQAVAACIAEMLTNVRYDSAAAKSATNA